jgi:hypothetical protein
MLMMFWIWATCSFVGRYQRFGISIFSPEDGNNKFLRNGAKTQNNMITILTVVKPQISDVQFWPSMNA